MDKRAVVFMIVGLVVAGLAHTAAGVWLLAAFPRLRAKKRLVVAILAGLVPLEAAARFVTLATRSSLAGAVFDASMCEWIVVLFSAVPLVLVRAGARVVERVAPPDARATDGQGALSRRQALERIGGLAVLGTTGSLVGWGALVGRYEFVADEVAVRIPGLPRALDGYTITQISDLHIGLLVSQRDIQPGLDLLARQKANLVVVTGDVVDFDPRYIPAAMRALSGIRARDGVFAVYGNHDHYTGAAAVGRALRSTGVDVLVNRGRVIRPRDGGGFALLGVDDLAARRFHDGDGPRLDLAERDVPDDRPRILLSHQPRTVDAWPGRVALQLSGHTHGGQFNPGFRPVDLVMRYVAGRYEVGETTLYVNRGFGVVGPPARVGAPPEVTKIVLVSA